jgi:hypothetical protein
MILPLYGRFDVDPPLELNEKAFDFKIYKIGFLKISILYKLSACLYIYIYLRGKGTILGTIRSEVLLNQSLVFFFFFKKKISTTMIFK